MIDAPQKQEKKSFEQSFINELAKEILLEQRRSRRWGIFFKLLFSVYFFIFLGMYIVGQSDMTSFSIEKHAALVDIQGVISADAEARADYVVTGLRKAFKDENTKGVILRINSPGGSPVQAGYINDEINRLRKKYPDTPIYAVISDICASGGYYIASAADKIYANKASIVGSIGVVMPGFGFVDAIDKLGIERRLLHAGKYKGLLDPFQPIKNDEQVHIQNLIDEIHQQFIDVVKSGRGVRLVDDEKLYSGLIWSGEESVELGLIDGLASASQVAKDVIGVEEIVDYTVRESYFDQFAKKIGSTLFDSLAKNLELR